MPTPEETFQSIESRLQSVESGYRQILSQANNIEALDAAKGALLADDGDLIQVLRDARTLSPEWQPQLGVLVGAFRDGVEAAYQERATQI